MAEILALIILGLLVVAQTVERYFFAKHMTEQLEKCMKAVMSRNINDYLTATNEPKKDDAFIQTEQVNLEEATDDEFLDAIRKSSPDVV